MEKKIFDLNEYSLEVKDGKAVVERKEKGFKDGDFLVTDDGYIFIHWKAGDSESGLGIYACWHLESDDLFVGCARPKVKSASHATEGQKRSMLDRLSKEGYWWACDNIELINRQKSKVNFNKGDFVCFYDNAIIGILDSIEFSQGNIKINTICCLFGDLLIGNNRSCDMNCVRHATEREKRKLLDSLKEVGYVWDAKNLELRKKYGPTDFKHGDFVCFGSGCIGIYKDKAINGELFWTRCFLGNDKFTSYSSSHPFTEMRLASEEERKRLLDAIDKEGLFWDSEKLELRKKFDFDDGAFVADADGDLFIHWKGGDTCYSHGSYVYWDRDNDDVILESAGNMTTGDRPATRDEICALFDRLAKDGLVWDRENKITKKKRWRAKKGEDYWYVTDTNYANVHTEDMSPLDNMRFYDGNYFSSEKIAKKVAEEIRKVFEKYKEE